MFKTLALSCVFCTLALSIAFAEAPSNVTSKDKKFVTEAASGGMLEVQLGQYAATNGASQEVKDFGQQMVTDHTKANEELRALASTKGIEIPAVLNSKNQKTLDRIEKYQGAEFDKKYMNAMVKDHEEDVSEFKKESEKGTDPEIKAFADKTLPTLNHHLEMAKEIEGKLK